MGIMSAREWLDWRLLSSGDRVKRTRCMLRHLATSQGDEAIFRHLCETDWYV